MSGLTYDSSQMAAINQSSGGGGASSTGNALTSAGGAMSMIPGMQAVGAATSIAGLGLSAYGQYKANQTAEKNYKLLLRQYLEQKRRQEEIDKYNEHQTELANTMAYGKYAGDMKKNIQSSFGSYNASVGK